MTEDDIEGCFIPMVKLYRSGKQYIVRVNINSKADAKPLKIYDEDEMAVEPAQITDKTPVIAILEIQGVRCTSKSFCVDLEMKQLMVLKPSDLFDSFIISKNRKPLEKEAQNYLAKTDTIPNVMTTDVIEESADKSINHESDLSEEPISIQFEEEGPIKIEDSDKSAPKAPSAQPEKITSNDEYLGLTDSSEILEFDLDVNEIDAAETFQLRDKKEVYYEMYREALQKAKAAKAIALTEFMEARRIKNLYMLKDLDDSDESDLEDLDDLDNDDE
jgi:hypothetical protein